MEKNIFFENIIKMKEAASSGLNLTKNEKGNPNLQFFLALQDYLDCDVVFTKSTGDVLCPSMSALVSDPRVAELYDSQGNGKPKFLIVKGKNKTKDSKSDCRLYINQNYKTEIYDRINDSDDFTLEVNGDKATITYKGKSFTVQESGAEEKTEKRTAKDGKIAAYYLDDKILPSTKAQLDEFFSDLDVVYDNKDVSNALKDIISYQSESASEKVKDLVEKYTGKRSGTDNIRYELTPDTIGILKDAFLKIAAALDEEKYASAVEAVFSGDFYGKGIKPEYIESAAIISRSSSDSFIEFYCSQHFPLLDFVVVKQTGDIEPYSVKDENGGNKSTCCRFLSEADKNPIFSKFEVFKSSNFEKINDTLEKICSNINYGYSMFKVKIGKDTVDPEVGVEYPMCETANKQSDWFGKTPNGDTISKEDVLDLGIYLASYLCKYSQKRTSADGSIKAPSFKNIPGKIFSHFKLGPNSEKVLTYNGEFLLNQCEKVAVNIINENDEVLQAIQESIEGFGKSVLGTPVLKIKPARSGGFEVIPQDSKMVLKSLSSRGGGGKLGIIKLEDGSAQVTAITTTGQGQFFGYEFVKDDDLRLRRASFSMKESKKHFFDRIIEISQSDWNQMVNRWTSTQSANAISPREKWDLKMNIADLKHDLNVLQNTASELPDDYVDVICDVASYPFDDPIDDDQALSQWCGEIDDFLSQDLNQWGCLKKR